MKYNYRNQNVTSLIIANTLSIKSVTQGLPNVLPLLCGLWADTSLFNSYPRVLSVIYLSYMICEGCAGYYIGAGFSQYLASLMWFAGYYTGVEFT